MTPDPAPDETERVGDLCAACGHERGEHLPPCEMGISTGRPCGCRQFKVPDETERAEFAEAEAEHRLREFYLRDPEMAVKDHANTLTVLSECIRKNAELRAESSHRRDALHHAWAERDRLRSELAELKAGRAAGTPPGVCLCRFGSTCDVCGLIPATFCAHHGDDNYFDRTVCASPCDMMHTRCRECHTPLDPCAHSTPADRGPLTPHPPPWPVDEP